MRIAIYSRKSIETDRGESIKNQIEICKEYFLRRNNNIEFEIFEDEGFSGGNINRPSFKIMMSRVKNKEFNIVACYKIDRIARNVVDFVNVFDELNKLDVKLVSVTEGFDPSTPIGKLIMMILASFAEMERENIKQRVKDSMKEMAKTGKWTGGTVPFGYVTERVEQNSKKATYLKLDKSKCNLIEKIFNYYLKTKSMHQVQKWLYTEYSIKWNLSTVKNVLTSPIYVKANSEAINYLKNFGEVFGNANGLNGLITYNRRPYSNGKHRWNDKSMFYAISNHEGIIPPKIWLNVQSIQEKNKISPRPKNSKISYLTGVLKCAKCGSPITISYNHKNKDGTITYVYLCTGKKTYGKDYCNYKQIKQTILDKKIESTLNQYVNLPFKEFEKIFGKKSNNNLQDKINSIQKKILSNNKKISNLIDKLMLLSNEAGALLTKKIEEMNSENESLKKELLFLQQDNLNKSIDSLENKYEKLKFFMSILNTADIDTKREIIESIVQEICFDSILRDVNIII